MAGAFPDDVELAFQGVGNGDAAAASDENLPDHGFQTLGGLRQIAVVDRNIPPSQQDLSFIIDGTLDLVLTGNTRSRIARQKYHADPILPRRRQLDTLLRHLLAQESIGNLDETARAVGELGVVAYSAAVGEIS